MPHSPCYTTRWYVWTWSTFKNIQYIGFWASCIILWSKDSEIDLLVREKQIGYCGWPEKWDKDELMKMGERARELAINEYSETTILNKFIKAI